MTLRKEAFSAGRWTTASVLARALTQVVQIMVLARILAPADFGLMAIAGAAVAVAAMFSDFGLGSALMHFPRPGKRVLSTLYWLNIGLACALAICFCFVSVLLAGIYRHAELLPVLLLLALNFPLNAFGSQFRVLAEKEMRFRTLAKLEAAATLAGFVVAVSLSWLDAGVYALVGGSLAANATGTALSWTFLSTGARPTFQADVASAKPFLAFGLHRVGDDLWNTMRMQSDILVASLFAPASTVAFYATPRDQCLRIANTVVNPVITRIGLPIMTRLQDDPARLREIYRKTLNFTASLNFPAYALLALFPADVVGLLLGAQWHEASPFLRIFALWALVRSTGNPSGILVYAVGMAKRAHAWNFLLFFITVPLFYVAASRSGLLGLAATMLLTQLVTFVFAWLYLIRPACGMGFREYCSPFLPPLIATLAASGAAAGAALAVPGAWRLAVGVPVMAIVYLGFSHWVNRNWLLAMRQLLAPAIRVPG
ncbi:MAG TPA: MOP flippase family protein [Lysobacter sp.]|nr:MOP flippase family protein [Lysobacter sp.]